MVGETCSTWLTTQIHEFVNTYPEIDVSLILSDNELDLGMREADVAIRMVMPRQPGLVQRHLLTVRSHVYASHGYIQKYGKPKTVEELDQHRLIIFGEDARAPVQDVNGLLHEGNVDPSVTLQYDIAPRIMVYATWGRGSKSGGFVSNTLGTTSATQLHFLKIFSLKL